MSKDLFQVKFWGVRGSIPVSGPEFDRYGGNTSCIEIRCGEYRLLFDAGVTFFDHPTPPDNHFRLGYSAIPLDRIEPGIAALARLVRVERRDPQPARSG